MGSPRLRDVAELAGVSERTVANVANGYKHVSEGTRARVQAAIDQLGYAPNATARRLARGRTGMLALSIPHIDAPYFAELAAAIIDEAEAKGLGVHIEQTDGRHDRELASLAHPERGRVDGLIFQPSSMSSAEVADARRDMPLVLLGEGVLLDGAGHVMIDNVLAAREATVHLLEMECTALVYLGDAPPGPLQQIARGRIAGWRQAIEAWEGHAEAVSVIAVDDWFPRAGHAAMTSLIESGRHFDAVLCSTDLLAFGALAALAEHGVRVPHDVAVVGWDDTAAAAYMNPSLTTVAPDLGEIAKRAVDLLARQMDGDPDGAAHEIAPHHLERRASTDRPRRSEEG